MPAAQQSHIRVLPHIRRAIDAGGPVVALESSVFAQGLPQPQNAEAAQRMIAAVERTGAVPAITAVVCGSPTLGLESPEMERFLRRDGIKKVSARDLGAATVQRHDGATTVAASLAIASRAGVRVLATGGIGGVHRQLPDATLSSWIPDESADLYELARTPMVVVCAGAKSILDLRATWERLDTLGIPVIGMGTREFPGFFSATSGIRLSISAASAEEVAEIATAHFGLGRAQAVLVVQPPPAEVALDAELVERAVQAALQRAASENVRGSDVTPYVLAAVSQETGGRTLQTNLGLLEANARQAASIAVAWSRIARDRDT
ncbi:MAG TPA: pseudouridine-5'-phosphate glycosidase [Gemmatimonadaceae bacterium]|nr:pseudouridine-5'-phosphate glycosidase [Gemmatimonadaceae bacterium]